jgi:glycosyltransferase involved in cell wall biosynthesis
MGILYLPHFELSEDSKFCRILRDLPGNNYVRIGTIFPTYKYRWQLYLQSWSRLIGFGLSAIPFAKRNANIIVGYSHLVLLPFVLLGIFGFRPRLVLVGFIYTNRSSLLSRCMRWLYYYLTLSRIDLVIVHSTSEFKSYPNFFKKNKEKFAFIPVSTHIASMERFEPMIGDAVVSAGRSNRDYDLLTEVATRFDVPFKIICDSFYTNKPIPENVEILRDCHQDDYLRCLAEARVVVIPLRQEGESSGQMVLLHSMALGKAIVLTQIEEMLDYIDNKEATITVPCGDAHALETQLKLLYKDTDRIARIGKAAAECYSRRYTLEYGINSLAEIIDRKLSNLN